MIAQLVQWLGNGLDGPRFDSWHRKVCLFSKTSRLTLQPTRPPIQWVVGVLSLEVKQPGHEADHSVPSCDKVMNQSSYTPIPPQPAQEQLHLYVLYEIYDISCVPALIYLNRNYQWQKLFCKYNEFNYQSLKECWIIWLTSLLSLTDNKIMGVLSLMNLHMCIWNSCTHPFTTLYYRTGWLNAVITRYRIIILSDPYYFSLPAATTMHVGSLWVRYCSYNKAASWMWQMILVI
jgi:hypothetical protein